VKEEMPDDLAEYFSFINPAKLKETLNPALSGALPGQDENHESTDADPNKASEHNEPPADSAADQPTEGDTGL